MKLGQFMYHYSLKNFYQKTLWKISPGNQCQALLNHHRILSKNKSGLEKL